MTLADFTGPGADELARDLAEERSAPPPQLVAARAAVGLPTHEPGRRNRWRFVAIEGGEVTIAFPPEASR